MIEVKITFLGRLEAFMDQFWGLRTRIHDKSIQIAVISMESHWSPYLLRKICVQGQKTVKKGSKITIFGPLEKKNQMSFFHQGSDAWRLFH